MNRLNALSGPAWVSVAPLLLGAITVMFGLQVLRTFVVGLAVYLAQAKDVNPGLVGVIGLAVFVTAFLAPVVYRVLGRENAFVVTAGGLGLVRLAEQLVPSVPVGLGLAVVGTVLFLWFLPLLFLRVRADGEAHGGYGAIALLLGISADTAVKGVFGTVDLTWVEGVSPSIVAAGLTVAQWLLLWRLVGGRDARDRGRTQGPLGTAVPYLVIGPALTLEILLFQNVAHQTVLIGWPQPAVFAWILAANVIGIATAVELTRRGRPVPWPVQAVLAGLLVAIVAGEQSGVTAALIVIAGQFVIATALVSAAAGPYVESERRTSGVSAWTGAGMVTLLLFIFLYYAGYDTDVVVPKEAIPPIAALLVGFAAVRAGLFLKPEAGGAQAARVARVVAIPALLLLVLPLFSLVAWNDVSPTEGVGFPVRVMSYNLHQGFDVGGRLGMEALAEVIEAQDPDILALQEVSRGWVVNDSVDMLVWLSQRLDMPYVWGPATDSVWGNAVLSRFPITKSQNHSMPNNNFILIDRGFLSLEIDLGAGDTLDIVATHFHSGGEDSALRITQALEVLRQVDQNRSTVLLGDLNAHPDHPEMLLMIGSGLNDTFVASGETGDGFTARSNDPWERIDYIWATADLKPRNFTISQSLASDHFAVSVTLHKLAATALTR